jgi:hypothetical protein
MHAQLMDMSPTSFAARIQCSGLTTTNIDWVVIGTGPCSRATCEIYRASVKHGLDFYEYLRKLPAVRFACHNGDCTSAFVFILAPNNRSHCFTC